MYRYKVIVPTTFMAGFAKCWTFKLHVLVMALTTAKALVPM